MLFSRFGPLDIRFPDSGPWGPAKSAVFFQLYVLRYLQVPSRYPVGTYWQVPGGLMYLKVRPYYLSYLLVKYLRLTSSYLNIQLHLLFILKYVL